ncbi:MAG: hypothetical protein A2266_02150 [Bacteroidetes bacterium RIFOXYA12_FULL_40_10]|nr:MAG: hypothetical protein A2266_02150 [Bacteroidetes bacterium RIFOXYA12_FULL_40_10]
MKFKINILLLIMILLSAAGCQKDEIIVFDVNDSGVMFPGAGDAKTYKGYNSADQIYYVNESFLNVPLSQVKYIVDFPVRVSGDTVSRDRVIGYEVVAQMTDALNTQYKIVDAIIPAGEYYGRIRFELTRDVALDNASVKVGIKLKDSDDLKVGSNEYCKGVLSWSNMLPKFPASSSYTRTYNCIVLSPLSKLSTVITYYSPNAHKAILEALGWPINYWPTFSSGFADPGTGTSAMFGAYYTDLYAQKLKTYLDAYALANGGERLKHNAGTDIGKDIQPRVTGAVYIP